MTESSQVWLHTRKALAPYGRVQRIENRLEDGWPDVVYTLLSTTGWLELKLAPRSGRCPDHLTREQVMWGEAEVAAGGRWHLLLRCGREWWLMNAVQARLWFDEGIVETLVRTTGKFPTREILPRLTGRHYPNRLAAK